MGYLQLEDMVSHITHFV